ncbi:unnamed protein product [Penicillium egyptiacum]|uniref:Uncharacterized protein n=1 Tax=Penicillium egyptiacum TaxID=1303716 RepID=A0A9W4P8S6_9EURO|nr:unnamed protein product [Penicillium egyptiacum]
MLEVKQHIFVIILMLTMAILEDAFKSNVRSLEEIFRTRVSHPHRSVKLDFKQEKLNLPICRQPISTSSGMSTHGIKPLKYHTYLYFLKRLSLAAGMIRAIKPYDLRRGTGEAVDSDGPRLCQHLSETYESTCLGLYLSRISRNTFGRCINEDS